MTKQITEAVEILSLYDFCLSVVDLRSQCDRWIATYGDKIKIDIDMPFGLDERPEPTIFRDRDETAEEEADRIAKEKIREQKMVDHRKRQYDALKKEFGNEDS